MYKQLCTAFIFLKLSCIATELQPWFEEPLLVHSRLSYTFQTYKSVAVAKGSSRKLSDDSFVHTSLAANFDSYALEVEALTAQTSHRNFGWDTVKATGRYQLMDDVLADPVSLTAGLSIGKAWKQAVHDLSSFHHGRFETEFHLACGKETSRDWLWTSRFWGVAALGLADSGSPWLRFDSSLERNYSDLFQVRFSVDTLWGLGKRGLHLSRHFHGYGSINHQSVDLATRLSYFFVDVGGSLSLEYAYRAYAKNFPKNTSRLTVQLYYPFSPASLPFVNFKI